MFVYIAVMPLFLHVRGTTSFNESEKFEACVNKDKLTARKLILVPALMGIKPNAQTSYQTLSYSCGLDLHMQLDVPVVFQLKAVACYV
jgi:hypothetical protein